MAFESCASMRNTIRERSEVWRDGGGEFDTRDCPEWFDRAWLESLLRDLEGFGPWLSQGFDNQLSLGVTRSPNIRSTASRVGVQEYLALIPIGLIVRLDALVRLLDREQGAPRAHVINADFYEGLPGEIEMRRADRPRAGPLAVIADLTLSPAAFWEALARLDAEDRTAQNPGIRADQRHWLSCAVLFCAFHEAVHVLRRHHSIVSLSDTRETRRGAEMDADVRAARWLALSNQGKLGPLTEAERLNSVAEFAWDAAYAMCLCLGMFDLDRVSISSFLDDVYNHPSVRCSMCVNGLLHAYGQLYSPAFVRSSLVRVADDAVAEYMGRMNQLWLRQNGATGRPTSLYFPSIPPKGANIPFGKFLDDAAEPIRKLFEDPPDDYRAFCLAHQDLLFPVGKGGSPTP